MIAIRVYTKESAYVEVFETKEDEIFIAVNNNISPENEESTSISIEDAERISKEMLKMVKAIKERNNN